VISVPGGGVNSNVDAGIGEVFGRVFGDQINITSGGQVISQ
jgi:hypothetical protein